MPETDEKITEWLVEECQETGRKISALVQLDERLLAIGATLVIGAGTLLIARDREQFLVAGPFVISLFVCFMLYVHAETLALGGHKAALEEALKERIGTPVVLWESQIAPVVRHRSVPTIVISAYVVALYVASSVAAILAVLDLREERGWVERHRALSLAATVASIFAGTAAAVVSYGASRKAYEKAKKLTAGAFRPAAAAPGEHAPAAGAGGTT